MNKAQLIDETVSQTKGNFTKTAVIDVVDTVLTVIKQELAQGGTVNLSGFGIFETAHREGMEGRNPRTGERIDIAAKTVAKFRPNKALRDALNEPEPERKVGAQRYSPMPEQKIA